MGDARCRRRCWCWRRSVTPAENGMSWLTTTLKSPRHVRVAPLHAAETSRVIRWSVVVDPRTRPRPRPCPRQRPRAASPPSAPGLNETMEKRTTSRPPDFIIVLDARAAPRAPLFRHDVGSSRPVVRRPAPVPGGHQRCPRRRRRKHQQRRRWGVQPPRSSHVSLIRSPRACPRKSDASSARGKTGVPRRQTAGRGRGVPPLIWRSHAAIAGVRGGAKHGRKRR